MAIAKCIVCNCDDLHACHDEAGEPCSWVMVDYERGIGVCSNCAQVFVAEMEEMFHAFNRIGLDSKKIRLLAAGYDFDVVNGLLSYNEKYRDMPKEKFNLIFFSLVEMQKKGHFK